MTKAVYSFVETILLVIACIAGVFVLLGRVAVIDGSSMEPNLHDGDVVAIRTAYAMPDRGEIVAVGRANDRNASFVKRVVALAGDEIFIDFETHLITINGEVIPERYEVLDALRVQGDLTYPATVPEGCVFVLGDNRNDSLDSRFTEIGFIRQEEIAGVAMFRLLPFGQTEIG